MVLGGWGATISGLGHAAVVALAIWALPWLRAGPDPGAQVVSVSLVNPSELVPPPPPAPSRTKLPEAETDTLARPEATVPHEDVPAEAPPANGLAGRFDPAAPLGLGAVPEPGSDAARDELEPEFDAGIAAEPATGFGSGFGSGLQPEFGTGLAGPPDAALGTEAGRAGEPDVPPMSVEAFLAEVRAAVERAKVYPPVARERGLYGTAEVGLVIGPAGEVMALRLLRSSGAKALDDAARAAVRAARLPAPPVGSPYACGLEISFTRRDN